MTINRHYTLFFSCLLVFNVIKSEDNARNEAIEHLLPKTINFSYENEELINVINYLASLKEVNVILPQGGNAIKEKLTLHVEKKLTLDEAWDLLLTILDVADYSMEPKKDMFMVVKNSKNISREPMPIYIGTNPEKLPDTDQRIRYLYYLANIKVSDATDNELNVLLKALLPANALIKSDPITNGLLIVAKANDIRSVMYIVKQLDSVGFQEKMEIIKLRNSSAGIVAKLINENILKTTEGVSRYRLDTRKKRDVPYFSKFTTVIPEKRTNSLIIMGRSQVVERLKDFILTYIDDDLDAGKSILHVYQLQYLDAEKFASVLQKIVESSRTGGPGQARAGEKVVGGTERFFDEIIIKADRPGEAEELKYYGGNNLIIAARNEDWRQIKKIIEELDTPQPQVLIEVLVVDLTVNDTRLLGALSRTPDKIPLPSNFEFQSAHLDTNIIPDKATDPTTIHSDLLQKSSAASFASAGSTLINLADNDGETFSILQLLKLFTHSKILSHPHIIATNNKKAEVKIGEERLLTDEATGSLGGTTTVTRKPISAELKIEITPRISTADTVNLQVLVKINEFIDEAGGGDAQTIRQVETNANINSGSIFALGGLTRVATSHSINETPILSKIPILGWFFKRRQERVIKNNLTVFISPTIIQPRLRSGVSEYTRDYIQVAKNYASESNLFDSLTQPITRWFFKTDTDAAEALDQFMAKDTIQTPAQKKETPKRKQQKKRRSKEQVYIQNKQQEQRDLKTLIQNDDNPFERLRNAPTESFFQPQESICVAQNNQLEQTRSNLKTLLQNDENPFIEK